MSDDLVNQLTLNFLISKNQLEKLNKKNKDDAKIKLNSEYLVQRDRIKILFEQLLFNNEPDDIRMDVTSIINLWVSGSLPNNGFVLHHHTSASIDSTDYGVLKFFSKETNTIYEPKLEIVWNDSVIATGSLAPVTGSAEEGYKVVFTNLKTKYQKDSLIKLRVKGRDMFPLKTFGTTYELDQNKYLPTTTYYQLEDYVTGEVIYPFGTYTKISCDSTSNYFNMNLNTLPANRVYKIKLKIVEGGISTLIDDKLIFEIVE